MIGYVTVGSNELDKSRAFYDALMPSVGASRIMEFGDNFTMSGGKIDAALRCEAKSSGTMNMTINGTYSRDSYEATMAMDMSGGPKGGMKIRSHSESHRIGACSGDEINAKKRG